MQPAWKKAFSVLFSSLFLQLNLKLGGGVQANSAISPASIKQRLGSYREYLWKQCLNCANRIGQWRPGGQKKGRRKSQCSTGEIGDEPAQQYWGPLIGTVIQKLKIPFGNSTLLLGADDKKMSVLITKPNQKVMHNNLMIFFQRFSIVWTLNFHFVILMSIGNFKIWYLHMIFKQEKNFHR